MNNRATLVLLLACATTLGACAKKAPPQLPPAPVDTISEPASEPSAAPDTGPAVGSQTHFENATNGQNVIYFETDRFNIDNADAAALQAQAQYLALFPQINITLEGHCDERGTREYNLALGERRANAAKNYLVSLGVSPSRITAVSYGKERPFATQSNAEAWALNRRAVSVVVN